MAWLGSEHIVREKAVGFLHLSGVVRIVSGMPEVPGEPRGTARTEPLPIGAGSPSERRGSPGTGAGPGNLRGVAALSARCPNSL